MKAGRPHRPVGVLGERQVAVLAALRDMTAEAGYAPTIRELGERVGLRSSSSVMHHLDVLRIGGYITWNPTQSRTIRVLALVVE